MFETVSPNAFVRRSRRLAYESLPVSIGLHAAVVGAVAAAALWTVTFPDQPPRLSFRYIIASLEIPPPPPPPPPPAPRAASGSATPSSVITAPVAELAPTVIPDLIPIVPTPQRLASLVAPGAVADSGPDLGVPGGVEGGVAGGEVGGVKGGTLGGIPGARYEADGRLHFERDAPLGMYVESQMIPDYPEKARLLSWEDTVVVHYIIGKDGRVYDVRTVKKPYHKEFEPPALDAIAKWRFRPMMVDGSPVEVVHELTVYFRLE